jgi:hypothetical protein
MTINAAEFLIENKFGSIQSIFQNPIFTVELSKNKPNLTYSEQF